MRIWSRLPLRALAATAVLGLALTQAPLRQVARADDAPVLPPYVTATSPDAAKPLWPDQTGANAGYWATPSAGPVGDDDPSKLTSAQLYDRIAHNLFSINMVW